MSGKPEGYTDKPTERVVRFHHYEAPFIHVSVGTGAYREDDGAVEEAWHSLERFVDSVNDWCVVHVEDKA